MSGLFESLSSTSRALDSQRVGLDVVGQNLANINTPGYSRRSVVLAEVPPSDPLSAGRGVTVVGIQALRDQLVEGRLRREQGSTAYDSAMADTIGSIESTVGLPGASLDVNLTRFFDAFSALAGNPTSVAARDAVVGEGSSLGAAFGDLSNRLNQIRTDADANIRSGVSEVNRLTAQLALLNVDIAAAGHDVESLKDQQAQILGRLGELADVATMARADGGVDVTLNSGEALVIGGNAYTLDLSPNGLAAISIAGVDVTNRITSGRIGGLLNVRDQYVPDYISHLDSLAFDLSSAVNALHSTGFDASGAPAGNFFTPLAGPAGAATAFTVDAAVVADSSRVAASATGAVGDNAIANQLAALRNQPIAGNNTRTPFGAWGQLVFEVGSDAADARANATSHTQVVKQLQELQAQASGVSYDEEAANMMRYQRAYEANARYFQTILKALDSLMDMVH